MARIDEDLLNYKSNTLHNDVLINELGIDDVDDLERMERIITTKRLAELYINPGKQTFNVDHYLRIHKYLFDGIYPFAGEIRTEVIRKRITFCLPNYIYFSLGDVLKRAYLLVSKINNRDDLVDFITYFYAELDVIHPFREGNGRCEREFVRQYIDYICMKRSLGDYYLDYNLIGDREEFIDAVVEADMCNYGSLKNIFNNILVDRGFKLKK